MSRILVNVEYKDNEEIELFKEHLNGYSWENKELTTEEMNGLNSILNYIINERVLHKAGNLSYTELLVLKAKLQK